MPLLTPEGRVQLAPFMAAINPYHKEPAEIMEVLAAKKQAKAAAVAGDSELLYLKSTLCRLGLYSMPSTLSGAFGTGTLSSPASTSLTSNCRVVCQSQGCNR